MTNSNLQSLVSLSNGSHRAVSEFVQQAPGGRGVTVTVPPEEVGGGGGWEVVVVEKGDE
jgi:hypothetical protein